jgi:hypothetical protein
MRITNQDDEFTDDESVWSRINYNFGTHLIPCGLFCLEKHSSNNNFNE